MSWQEMQPKRALADQLPARLDLRRRQRRPCEPVSSGSVPSRAASASGSLPTLASPNCGMRRPIHGRARPACVSTCRSQGVRSLWPTPVSGGGLTASAFSAFSYLRSCSTSLGRQAALAVAAVAGQAVEALQRSAGGVSRRRRAGALRAVASGTGAGSCARSRRARTTAPCRVGFASVGQAAAVVLLRLLDVVEGSVGQHRWRTACRPARWCGSCCSPGR